MSNKNSKWGNTIGPAFGMVFLVLWLSDFRFSKKYFQSPFTLTPLHSTTPAKVGGESYPDEALPAFSPFSTQLTAASECRVKPDGPKQTTFPAGINVNVFGKSGDWFLVESTEICWVNSKNLKGELEKLNAIKSPPLSKCVDRRFYSDAIRAAAPPSQPGWSGLELNYGTARNTYPDHQATYFTKTEFEKILSKPITGFMDQALFGIENCLLPANQIQRMNTLAKAAISRAPVATGVELQNKVQSKIGKWCAKVQTEQNLKEGFAGTELEVEFKDESGIFIGRGESRWGCIPNHPAGQNNCHSSFVAVPSVFSDDSVVFTVPKSNGYEYNGELSLSNDTFNLSGEVFKLTRNCYQANR